MLDFPSEKKNLVPGKRIIFYGPEHLTDRSLWGVLKRDEPQRQAFHGLHASTSAVYDGVSKAEPLPGQGEDSLPQVPIG